MNETSPDEAKIVSGKESTVPVKRPELLPFLKLISVVTIVLILIQAALAGRGWFLADFDLIEIHGFVGNVTFLSAIVTLILAWTVSVSGQRGKWLLSTAAVLTLLIVAQTGLGYGTRDSIDAAAWHIPLGVLVFGVSAVFATLAIQIESD